MIRSGLGLRALGPSVVLISALAFAGSAQAEGAFWLVNGAKISTSLSPTVEAETDVPKALLTTLGGQFIDLTCQKVKLVGAHLIEPEGKAIGKLIFSECDFLSLKEKGGAAVLQKACEPFVGAFKGLIEINLTTGSIVLHEGTGALELKPTEGGLLVSLQLGEECAFGEELKVGGVLFLADATGKFATNQVKHLFEYLSSLTKLTINGGATTATIDGSAWGSLGGIHKGLTFSGQPG